MSEPVAATGGTDDVKMEVKTEVKSEGGVDTTTGAAVQPSMSPPPPPSGGGPLVATTGSSSGSRLIEQTMRMNQFFKTHSITHTDPHHKVYHDFCRANPGQEPPTTIFSIVVPTPFVAPNATPNSTPTAGTPSTGASTSTGGASPAVASKNVDMVRTICRMSYVLTHEDRTVRMNRIVEVQHIVNSLKSGSSGMSVLQANLMYQPERPQQHPSQQHSSSQQHHQGQMRSQGQSSQQHQQQLSAMPPGASYDPRRQQQQQQQQQLGMMGGPNPQQRGATKRKDAPGMGGPPMPPGYPMNSGPGPMPGAKQPTKYRKEHQETSAAEMRTQKALELQAANFGTTLAPPAMPSPSSSSSFAHMATPIHPSSHHSSRARPPAQAHEARTHTLPHPAQPVVATAFPVPGQQSYPMNGRSSASPPSQTTSLQSLWQQTKAQQADAHHLFLNAPALIQKVTAIASEHGLVLPQGENGLALVELLTLAAEGFLKNTLQSARYVSRRRMDLAKSYLPITVASDPRKELEELRRQADESKLRWAKHRELAEGDAKRKAAAAAAAASAGKELEQKNAEAAALEAKHAAAVAEAERLAREAAATTGATGGAAGGAAQSTTVEDDYILSLIGGGLGGATNGSSAGPAAAAAAPTPAPVSAPSFLPPSLLPPSTTRNFLPSSSLPGSSSSASTAPTIVLADLLTVMESHPQLRKSSRLYQSYTLLGKKKIEVPATSLQAPTRSPSPPPPQPVTSPTPPSLQQPMQQSPPQMHQSPPPQPQQSYQRVPSPPPPPPVVNEFWNAPMVNAPMNSSPPPAPYSSPMVDASIAALLQFGMGQPPYGLPPGLAPMPPRT